MTLQTHPFVSTDLPSCNFNSSKSPRDNARSLNIDICEFPRNFEETQFYQEVVEGKGEQCFPTYFLANVTNLNVISLLKNICLTTVNVVESYARSIRSDDRYVVVSKCEMIEFLSVREFRGWSREWKARQLKVREDLRDWSSSVHVDASGRPVGCLISRNGA